MSTNAPPSSADLQLALDAMRDGVALWTADGLLLVTNRAAATLMSAPADLIRPGVSRTEMMTFFARRGDYGPTDDPVALARGMSDRFGSGETTSLVRTLPDGRRVRADAVRLEDGHSLVTYQAVEGP